MSKEKSTQDQILDIAESMLQSRGFNSFSYRDIAETVGIKKASIHYYFPSKADLGVALVRRTNERFQHWADSSKVQQMSPTAQLDAYFENFQKILNSHSKICVNGMLGAEYNSLPEAVRQELKSLYRQQHQWICGLLTRGRNAGVFHENGSIESQAVWIGSAIQGGLQIARTNENTKIFFSVISQIKHALVK